MRPSLWKHVGAAVLVAGGLVSWGPWVRATRGEEPGRLGRLFRLGSGAPGASAETTRPTTPAPGPAPSTPATPPAGPSMAVPEGAGPRLIPQLRVSRPVTEADPLLTRVAIARSDDGNQFGMFLQVFADGTVLDTEGVHRAGPEALRPLAEAIQATEANRLRGHCGGPPTDFIEQVHVVVYDRALGRLRANAFSFSGNLQGCDPAVRQLQAAIDAFQAKLAGPSPASSSAAPPAGTSASAIDAGPIRLTPIR
jgi:hypothetical protein